MTTTNLVNLIKTYNLNNKNTLIVLKYLMQQADTSNMVRDLSLRAIFEDLRKNTDTTLKTYKGVVWCIESLVSKGLVSRVYTPHGQTQVYDLTATANYLNGTTTQTTTPVTTTQTATTETVEFTDGVVIFAGRREMPEVAKIRTNSVQIVPVDLDTYFKVVHS